MHAITNYIQERIELFNGRIKEGELANNLDCYARINELQAVLSKIEEGK